LWEAIRQDHELHELVRTPLLLSLLAFALREEHHQLHSWRDLEVGDLRDKIFEAYLKKRYAHEARRRNANLPFSYEQFVDMLGQLAMWNACDWRPTKPNMSLPSALFRPEPSVLIPYDFEFVMRDKNRITQFQKMAISLNILAPLERDHALAVSVQVGPIREDVRGGGQGEADETQSGMFLRGVMKFRFIHLRLRDSLAYTYALRCFHQVEWYEKWQPSPLNALFNLRDQRTINLFTDTLFAQAVDPLIRREIAYWLNNLEISTEQVEKLIPLLGDTEPDVRYVVALILGRRWDIRAIPNLIALLYEDEVYISLRKEAIELLGRIRAVDAVAPLIQIIENRRVWYGKFRGMYQEVCRVVATALDAIGTSEGQEAARVWRVQQEQ
jgi:hypothetical protein